MGWRTCGSSSLSPSARCPPTRTKNMKAKRSPAITHGTHDCAALGEALLGRRRAAAAPGRCRSRRQLQLHHRLGNRGGRQRGARLLHSGLQHGRRLLSRSLRRRSSLLSRRLRRRNSLPSRWLRRRSSLPSRWLRPRSSLPSRRRRRRSSLPSRRLRRRSSLISRRLRCRSSLLGRRLWRRSSLPIICRKGCGRRRRGSNGLGLLRGAVLLVNGRLGRLGRSCLWQEKARTHMGGVEWRGRVTPKPAAVSRMHRRLPAGATTPDGPRMMASACIRPM